MDIKNTTLEQFINANVSRIEEYATSAVARAREVLRDVQDVLADAPHSLGELFDRASAIYAGIYEVRSGEEWTEVRLMIGSVQRSVTLADWRDERTPMPPGRYRVLVSVDRINDR